MLNIYLSGVNKMPNYLKESLLRSSDLSNIAIKRQANYLFVYVSLLIRAEIGIFFNLHNLTKITIV
jgi:hypothetical protein